MSLDAAISLFGSLVTIVGTCVTLWYAKRAQTYRAEANLSVRKIKLFDVVKCLRVAQDDILKLPSNRSTSPRGFNLVDSSEKIKSCFDQVFSLIDNKGEVDAIRKFLVDAQEKFHEYEMIFNSGEPGEDKIHEVRKLIQDAISGCNSIIYEVRGESR